MWESKYANAGMDMKKLLLCFIGKIWMALLAALLGAVLGGGAYAVSRVVPESKREYQAMSKIYLDFAADETGEVYQAYNGYTWNDLMATDPILDVTMQYLPEDYTREEVAAAVKAEILSDLRLLTITVTTHDAGRCEQILQAAGQSLVERGNTAREFRRIEVIQTTEAKPVVADARWIQAITAGAALAAVLTLLGMFLCYVLDDRIMVASDLRQVTDAVFVGYSGAGERLEKDYEANLDWLRKKKGKIAVLSLRQKEAVGEQQWQQMCEADGVVLLASYKEVHAVYLNYVIEQLTVRECPLVATGIVNADRRFLSRYYGGASRKMVR
ncbi:MAG: hypothetical protein K2P48_06845 [Lachnospiraceae bacterium]|nr:hypothetical protein [Lachnospiraceae bacterium]